MSLKKNLYNNYNLIKSFLKIKFCKKQKFNFKNLRKKINLRQIFNDKKIHQVYSFDEKFISSSKIPDMVGGINSGDRKALYFLIYNFKPSKILEIGTHIGSSTLSMALSGKRYGVKFIDTVDLVNVNDDNKKYWKKYKSKSSPKDNLKSNKCEKLVNFITESSINFLKKTNKKYNFIFLDGNHSSNYVYKEISLALNLLEKNGIILLHDYFPNGQALWEDSKKIIYGPFLAFKRILEEGNKLKILPVGNLPWKTKFKTNKSSLALIHK